MRILEHIQFPLREGYFIMLLLTMSLYFMFIDKHIASFILFGLSLFLNAILIGFLNARIRRYKGER